MPREVAQRAWRESERSRGRGRPAQPHACHRHPGTRLRSIRRRRIGRPSPQQTGARPPRHQARRPSGPPAGPPRRPDRAAAMAADRSGRRPPERQASYGEVFRDRRVPCAVARPGTVLRRGPVCPGRDRDPGLRTDRIRVAHRAGVRADLPAADRRRPAAVRPGRPVPAPAHHDRLRPDPGGPGRAAWRYPGSRSPCCASCSRAPCCSARRSRRRARRCCRTCCRETSSFSARRSGTSPTRQARSSASWPAPPSWPCSTRTGRSPSTPCPSCFPR